MLSGYCVVNACFFSADGMLSVLGFIHSFVWLGCFYKSFFALSKKEGVRVVPGTVVFGGFF